MRAPNGAKIDLKSALFLRVKIKRIHCKKQGLGGGAFILKLDQNLGFLFFFGGGPIIIRYAPKSSCFSVCKKTVFSEPSVSPRQEAYFSGFRT